MTLTTHGSQNVLSSDEADVRLVEIAKGQQLAGHFSAEEALDRARRILTGVTSPVEAYTELDAKYAE